MNILKIATRTGVAVIVAGLCLGFMVSCSKKEEKQAVFPEIVEEEKAEAVIETGPDEEADAAKEASDQADTAAVAVIELEEAPEPVAASPKKRLFAQKPPPEPAKPSFAVKNIYGAKQVSAGQAFTLSCSTSGDGAVVSYIWRFRKGGEVIEKQTGEPKIEMTLDGAGEWQATCEVLGETGILASRTIKFKVTEGGARVASASKLLIEHIAGPKNAFAGQTITLKCNISGTAGSAVEYVWRFKNGDDVIEMRSREQHVTVKLEKPGEYTVICDVTESNKVLASQRFSIRVVVSQMSISAGGPYSAMMNKPMKVRGNAQTNTGRFVKYEWFFSGSDKPSWTAAENDAAQHVFTKSGTHKAVFKVTLADGSSREDTADVVVSSMMPTADAGDDVASSSGRRIKLKGSGKSPDGSIVRYEWDFDGDGTYDWSSDKSGEAAYAFKVYSTPVLRVTDTEGNTATDTMRVIICSNDMVPVPGGKFCVDRFEWPNKRNGAVQTNVTWREAVAACEGAGKRLCTSDEWQRACRNDKSQGESGRGVFPYGREFNSEKCNVLGNPKIQNRLATAGNFGGCSGSIGALDMSGNAAEWTTGEDGANAAVWGGFYQSGADASSCDSRLMLEKDRKYLYVGFRCCK